jgi:hypothetical protein
MTRKPSPETENRSLRTRLRAHEQQIVRLHAQLRQAEAQAKAAETDAATWEKDVLLERQRYSDTIRTLEKAIETLRLALEKRL